MTLPLALSPLTPGGDIPVWETGQGFRIGVQRVPVLEYSLNDCGWTDELTYLHEVAGEHFIDRASCQYALQQLCTQLAGKNNPLILEVGCSSGLMLRETKKILPHARLMGADVVQAPLLKLATEFTDIPFFRFDMTHCPLPDNSVDAVVMLNVLEHIEDDVAVMKQVKRILKPGGVLVLEVPAGPDLYDAYDKALMHYRRYSASALGKLISEQGFEIIKQSHLGCFLYPGFWWVKQRSKRSLAGQEISPQQIVEQNIRDTGGSQFLSKVMQAELFFGQWISYPFGIRCLMTCTV